MSTTRSYVMPSRHDEKHALVEELCRHYADFFGVPTRQALVAQWWKSSVLELGVFVRNWRGLMKRRAEIGVSAAPIAPPSAHAESRALRDERWRKIFPEG